MKKLLAVFVTIAFVLGFSWNGTLAVEAGGSNQDEANIPSPLIIGGEGLAALGGGAIVGTGTFMLSFYALWATVAASSEPWDMIGPYLGALAAGYGLGFPLGAAAGVTCFGEVASQRGSFGWSWAAAELGAISAIGLGYILSNTPLAPLAGPVLIAGPVGGAVIGYNLSRPKRNQAPHTSFTSPPGSDGSNLSLLVPEVELRHDRLSSDFQPAYKITLARLSF